MKKSKSWTLIIVLVIFVWPVGLFFLIRKLRDDKTAVFEKSSTLKYISFALMGFGVISIFMTLTGQMTQTVDGVKTVVTGSDMLFYIVVSLLFIAGGLLLFKKCLSIEEERKRYRDYISLIVNSNIISIPQISSARAVSSTQVAHDLQVMIDKGYFQNAYIDKTKQCIVLGTYENVSTGQELNHASHMAVCPGCGAHNIVIGDGSQCEYCGTILH
mgnify:FL=1